MPKTWSKLFVPILASNSDAWKNAKSKSERDDVVQVVASAIKDHIKSADGEDDEIPSRLDEVSVLYACWQNICLNLFQKIWNWFGNNVAKKVHVGDSAPKKGCKKTTSLRDVVKVIYKDRIRDFVSAQTDELAGRPSWLSRYPNALTQVMGALTQDELAEAEKLVDDWNDDGPPRDVQRM
jgi:hypothetical protein